MFVAFFYYISSLVPLPLTKPACSCGTCQSRKDRNLEFVICSKISLACDVSAIIYYIYISGLSYPIANFVQACLLLKCQAWRRIPFQPSYYACPPLLPLKQVYLDGMIDPDITTHRFALSLNLLTSIYKFMKTIFIFGLCCLSNFVQE